MLFLKFFFVIWIVVDATRAMDPVEKTPLEQAEEVVDILQLPIPEEVSSRSLEFGDTLALDDLGPIIINKDGSLRRITNWSELSPSEQKNTLRKISLRNHKRLGVLKNNERLDIIQKYYNDKAAEIEEQKISLTQGDSSSTSSAIYEDSSAAAVEL